MVTSQTSTTFLLVVAAAALVTERVEARPALPLLTRRGGCFWVSPEVALFRLEDEAVGVAFPRLQRVLHIRNLTSLSGSYLVARGNATGGVASGGQGRVRQGDGRLWLLPAQTSDSGEYTCYYRNVSYCIASSLALQVLPSSAAALDALSYSVPTALGQRARLPCPSLGGFTWTEGIHWFKDSQPVALSPSSELLIPSVQRPQLGTYTCLVHVLVHSQRYRVSRTIRLHLEDETAAPVEAPPPPIIVSPSNGSFYQAAHGSGVALQCTVLSVCPGDSTWVTWLLDSQSVEASYLGGRGLLGKRRVTRTPDGCLVGLTLVIVALTERDTRAEFKCVAQNEGGAQEVVARLRLEDSTLTWLLVAVVISCCFLSVVSIFLYFLLKPRRKSDYFLSR